MLDVGLPQQVDHYPGPGSARSGHSVWVATHKGPGYRLWAALRVRELCAALAVISLCLAAATCSGDSEPVELQAHFDWDFDPTQTGGTACSFGRAQFSDRSTGDPTRWRWQFPNGTASAEQNPVLDMEGVRSGDVTLTVWRGDASDSDTRFFLPDHC